MEQSNWETAPSLCALSLTRHAKTRPDDSGVNCADEIPAQHFALPLPGVAILQIPGSLSFVATAVSTFLLPTSEHHDICYEDSIALCQIFRSFSSMQHQSRKSSG
jgi:hypothetical protein